MLTSFMKMPLAAVTLSCLLYQPAQAWTVEVKPDNNPLGLGRPLIEVESDGEEWTNIRSATRQLQLRANVDVGSGWRVMDVWMKVPSADFCQSLETPAGCVRIFSGKTKHFSDVVTHEFSTDHIGGIEGQALVNKCNEANYQGDRDRDFEDFNISLGIKAYVLKRSEANDPVEPNQGRTTTAHTQAPIVLRCLAPPQRIEALKPVSVDLRVKQNGDTCPKDVDVTAYIDYDKPMTGRFKIHHNGKPGKTIEIKAREISFAGKTFYRIERLERYKLDPGKHNFQIKVIGGGKSEKKSLDVDCPPFEVTSTWLTYEVEDRDTCKKQVTETATIHANRPGDVPYRIETEGGLVVAQGIAYVARKGDQYSAKRTRKLSMGAFDQMMRLKIVNDPSVGVTQTPLKVECLEALSGKLTLQSLGATSCKGEALVAIHTNGAGELPYELECGPGKSWQRKVTAMANKIGVDKVRFDVSNNEQVTCVLRTRIDGVLKPLDGASQTFQCHKPTDAGASNDFVPESRPEDPPPVHPTLTGDFSFVDNGGTKCPRQGKALVNFKTSKPDNVHWSLDCTNGHFSGVAQTAPSPKGGFIAPALVTFDINQTTDAKCALKTVAPGKPKVHTLKGHTFQCVRTTGVSGADDLAPDTRPDPQKPDKPGKIVDPVKPDPGTSVVDPPRPTVSCANGAVKKGACTCEPNFKPIKVGQNAWRCVRSVADPKPLKPTVTQPKISCANGTAKNGACNCDRMHKPVKVGRNAWRCVRVIADPPKNKSGANKLELKTAPKKISQPEKTAKPKSGAGKTTGLKPKGTTARRPTNLLAPR